MFEYLFNVVFFALSVCFLKRHRIKCQTGNAGSKVFILVVFVDIVVVAYPVIKIAFVPKPQHLMGKMTNI
jgi:hypothetical protein